MNFIQLQPPAAGTQENKKNKHITSIYKYWTKYRGHACCFSPGVQACFLPVSLYLHLKICENPWFRGILTDWCCHADAVTVLMLDGLMIYGELWDAPNESRVNVHLSRQISGCGGLLTSSPDPTVEGTDWVAGLQLNPAHSREEDHARQLRRRRGGERRLMRPDQAQQWVTTEAMREQKKKSKQL